jgi:hypothetical protein
MILSLSPTPSIDVDMKQDLEGTNTTNSIYLQVLFISKTNITALLAPTRRRSPWAASRPCLGHSWQRGCCPGRRRTRGWRRGRRRAGAAGRRPPRGAGPSGGWERGRRPGPGLQGGVGWAAGTGVQRLNNVHILGQFAVSMSVVSGPLFTIDQGCWNQVGCSVIFVNLRHFDGGGRGRWTPLVATHDDE